jgi:hypothetical protein
MFEICGRTGGIQQKRCGNTRHEYRAPLFGEISSGDVRAGDRERLRAALIGCVGQLLPRADERAAVSAMLADHFSGRYRDAGVWVHTTMDTMRMFAAVSTALLLLLPGIPCSIVAEYVVNDTRETRGFFVRIRPCLGHRGQ